MNILKFKPKRIKKIIKINIFRENRHILFYLFKLTTSFNIMHRFYDYYSFFVTAKKS